MDDEVSSYVPRVFYCFVCVTLTLLLAINGYSYIWGKPFRESLDGDFSEVKFVVLQLTNALYEVNRKHDNLQAEIEKLSSSLPAMAESANRVQDVFQPYSRNLDNKNSLTVLEYDQRITDYALESSGGRVVDTGDTVEHVLMESPVGWALYMLSSWVCRSCSGARAIIQPGALPGECWAFRGSKGEAIIRLMGSVEISGVSLEHISPQLSHTREISSAPRIFKIEGMESRADPHPHDFGIYEYDKEGKQIQYFPMKNPSAKGYHYIRLLVMSNWGHPVYTCVYRIRVHGELTPGQGQVRPTSGGDVPQLDIVKTTD